MLSTELREPLAAALSDCGLSPRERILVAVSGGPDSTALLIAAVEHGLSVTAAHYDHALRDGSELVAHGVEDLCAGLGVELVTERRTAAVPKGSIQAAARSLRYDFLDRARAASGADLVALAHTADDVVEGAVLHLLRGCGPAGLRGMPARRGHYVRPMLGVWRSEVAEFLQRREVVAHHDPANDDVRFARVRVRVELLPALERDRPGIVHRFHRAALRAAAIHQAAVGAATIALDGGRLTDADLRRMTEPAAAEVLKLMYTRAGGLEPGLSRRHLVAMLRLTGDGPGGRGLDLPGAMRFRVVDHVPEIYRSESGGSHAAATRQIAIKTCTGCRDRDAAHLRAGLELRLGFRQPGLRMRPAGGRGSRKLQDIFVDARVPREEREGWPLVFAGGRLAWVPGIAIDADHAGRPGEPSLHVTISPMLTGRTKLVV